MFGIIFICLTGIIGFIERWKLNKYFREHNTKNLNIHNDKNIIIFTKNEKPILNDNILSSNLEIYDNIF
ncbi:MAG: hypothetical protein LBJ09_01285 [Clostridiales bacterium]|jgi:hypothetical protein|nr:hypothetical protein [Clostridiales bacterium]